MDSVIEKIINYLKNDLEAGYCDQKRYETLVWNLHAIANNDQWTASLISQIKKATQNSFPKSGQITEIVSSFSQKRRKILALPLPTEKSTTAQRNTIPTEKLFVSTPQYKTVETAETSQRSYADNRRNTLNTTNKPAFEEHQEIKVPKEEVWYFGLPDMNGFFWDDKKNYELKTDSFFKLTKSKANPRTGSLEVLTEDPKIVKVLLSSPNLYLKPVCNEINNNYIGQKIAMIKNGTAELRNGKWYVDPAKKITIKIN